MPYEFIERLVLPPSEKQKLRRLAAEGSDTPFKLLGLYKAVPEAFAKSTARELEPLLSDEERSLLNQEPRGFATGALLDLPPDLQR
jgi:hypothetical protein